MPNKIIKDGVVIEDSWAIIEKEATEAANGEALLPLQLWLQQDDRAERGLWLDSDESPEAIDVALDNIPLIAINFPAFADGRGFSYGRELRDRGFKGELRAIGGFMRDQLFYLQRCGFNAFALEGDIDAAVESLKDFSLSYQSVCEGEQPLLRRSR